MPAPSLWLLYPFRGIYKGQVKITATVHPVKGGGGSTLDNYERSSLRMDISASFTLPLVLSQVRQLGKALGGANCPWNLSQRSGQQSQDHESSPSSQKTGVGPPIIFDQDVQKTTGGVKYSASFATSSAGSGFERVIQVPPATGKNTTQTTAFTVQCTNSAQSSRSCRLVFSSEAQPSGSQTMLLGSLVKRPPARGKSRSFRAALLTLV
ncbi:hypothetical protein K491DRAFT_678298 [Lophiostoma macrostomum CBS 122681]|uniref:Uncharacterized protein n=1 Tax=Lophiostoma macrostomum CBS 122681 TaxID=1314788 RepID=A0A6A6TB21_9PLEO|nr:hypothetical protein K491DRAFT_678298 [Lophiostoma macrostomum CBS 122681]